MQFCLFVCLSVCLFVCLLLERRRDVRNNDGGCYGVTDARYLLLDADVSNEMLQKVGVYRLYFSRVADSVCFKKN